MSEVRQVVVAIGSNLGDRVESLVGAVQGWRETPGVTVVAVSPAYETVPVDAPDGSGDFLNAVLVIESDLPALTLLDRAQEIEATYGRRRSGVVNEPRTLDVDLIHIAGETYDEPRLIVPHPRAHLRGFVLVPWLAVDPGAEIQGHGRVADLVAALDTSDVRERTDLAFS